MKFLKSALIVTAAFALVLPLSGCSDDDDDPIGLDNDPPAVLLTAPGGGELVMPGGTFEITWETEDTGGIDDVTLTYTADDVDDPVEIASGLPASGAYTWTVPDEVLYGVRVDVTVTDSGGEVDSDDSDGIFAIVAASERGYVTSSTCQDCHAQRYDDLFQSGHPYKLNEVDGSAPTYPNSTVPSPPTGYAWNDITYVIGGYGWKARFLDDEGYIITTGFNGVDPQYNLPRPDLDTPNAEWVSYSSTNPERKPYTCGTCHTTGWQTDAENGGVNQDGLPGIKGTWEEAGIQCEACHGAGGNHVATKMAADITVDRNAELCGGCHFRDTNHRILASPPYIKHHEQYDEMIAGPHANLGCTTCHDPHKGVRYGNAAAGGILQDCQSCHGSVEVVNHPTAASCTDCHMSRASKSARTTGDFRGDVQTHIFRINTDPVGRDAMFVEEDGQTYAQEFVTLDYACYGCHKDESGLGGPNSTRTLEELSAAAVNIHGSSAFASRRGTQSSSDPQSFDD